jgi:hypothetical protein
MVDEQRDSRVGRDVGESLERSAPFRFSVDCAVDDWNELWWVRADGTARVVDPEGPEGVRALSLLADRYPRFAARGIVLAVDVRRWSGWAAAPATEEG